MPKLTWMSRPKVNHLAALLREYMKVTGTHSDRIGEKIHCSGSNVRAMLRRPARAWRVGELMDVCDVLGIPYQEAFDAATK